MIPRDMSVLLWLLIFSNTEHAESHKYLCRITRQGVVDMTDVIFWVGVGCLIGWNVPTPPWATWVWDKVTGFFTAK